MYINTEDLLFILNSKTLTKVFKFILDIYMYHKVYSFIDKDTNLPEDILISMEEIRKQLKYKNKSTVSRALQELRNRGIIKLSTDNRGTIIHFYHKINLEF